jgi:hypothetical protein
MLVRTNTEGLELLEQNFAAPVATLASPFDLPRCLADGIILCKLLETTLPKTRSSTTTSAGACAGAGAGVRSEDGETEQEEKYRIYGETGRPMEPPSPGFDGPTTATTPAKLSARATLAYLRAKKNVEMFVSRVDKRGVLRINAAELIADILNAVPSRELTTVVTSLILGKGQ